MIRRIRNSFWTKVVAVYLAINLVTEIVFPTMSMALTSGPVSIDQASFEPAATSEMVDLATGDFTYNIPLMDVDGYPINLAYHGGVDMDQEASMVGLGWTLNVGALNRSMRGLPDDFNGDEITTEMNLRPNYTVGGDIDLSHELLGFTPINDDLGPFEFNFSPSIGIGASFNNYVGFSTELSVGFSAGVSLFAQDDSDGQGSLASLGFNGSKTSNSRDGLTTSLGAGFSLLNGNAGIGVGYSYNTAEGLMARYVSTYSPTTSRIGMMPGSTISYTPNITLETNTQSLNFDFGLGGEFFGAYPHVHGGFFQSLTCNKNTSESVPAYGYNNLEEAPADSYLLDFNREGVILANENIVNLPIANHTYDMFSATAQGIGFSFRSHRSDVGTVGDMYRNHQINGVGVSGELGFGNIFQAGVNVDIPYGYSASGKWLTDNQAESLLEFVTNAPTSTGINQNLYERSYFKKFGNRSSSDEDFYNNMEAVKPIRQKISKFGITHIGNKAFVDKNATEVYTVDDLDHYKSIRDARNTNIEYLSASEASQYGQIETISNYSLSDYSYSSGHYTCSTATRYGTGSTDAKQHHLSEMTVLEGDGSRYVYGIPVMNKTSKEVMFNVSNESSNSAPALTKDCQHGLVSYTGGTENSMDNRRGDNNLYIKKTIPAYSSSSLLTAYLSSNYIDRTLDGPTPDDFGNYTKFNYAKTGTVKWRFPYEQNKAAYNEGLKADEYDDLGTYVYGERDQWYLHSIESKNFVAEFHYGDRHDGYGVTDENGGRASTNYSKRLVKIELYTRQGKMNGEAPIKTVHFEYDYSLCDNIPSNDGNAVSSEEGVSTNQGGKLTLKSIYFTYGESNRGKLHKYTFDYSTKNPNYELGAQDRWGTYKAIAASTACDETGNLTNIEYPYAEQNKATADENAGAWMLKTIHLPSGSDINVEVESDDYAYVQDVPATKMYKIRGFSETTTFVDGEKGILNESVISQISPHNYLHVELDNLGASAGAAKTNFLNNYLPSEEIYFRILVEVTPSAIPDNYTFSTPRYEYISGYAKVDTYGTTVYDQGSNGSYETVALKLKGVSLEDVGENPLGAVSTNPISKASWQFTRKYLPKIINPIVGEIYQQDAGLNCATEWEVPAYPEDGDIESDPEVDANGQFLNDIVNTAKSHLQNIIASGGINLMMATMGYSSECVPSKSWVRLGIGTNPKLGGGHRVKQITVNDNWDDVKATESASTYGSTYTYETTENGTTITSGVASYEPIASGGDENAMRTPVHYDNDVKMRVDDEEFQEFPYGETIFGNSSVVYSKVEVENIAYANVTQNSTGKTVYEQYTAKDFPIIFDKTGDADVSKLKDQSSGWTSLFSGESYNYLTMSQGYMIHMNDMHGKFKSKKVYGAQVGALTEAPVVYSMEHKYYTEVNNSKELKNLVSVVNPQGVISDRLMGRDMDLVVDANESKSLYGSHTFQAGIDIFTILLVVVPLPSVWYRDISVENRYRSSATTKVITSTGILEEVILVDKGRYKSSKNLLFDANTGVPVVTEINHEQPVFGSTYEKPIYQYDYPAYWMYKGMGLASDNWGAKFVDIATEITGGHYKINLTGYQNYLNPGDELAVYNLTDQAHVGKFWVVEDETNGEYYLVDESGDDPVYPLTDSYQYKVIRSGKRNLLGSTAASVTSLTKYTTSPYADGFSHTAVLNASAVEYTDQAFGYASSKSNTDPKNYCGLKAGQIANPYIWGLRGNWNLLTSYVYDTWRDQTTGHTRIDGALSDYLEFWENNSGVWVKNTTASGKWIQAALATLFEREGFNLESKDALGIYSSILLGYNNTLKIAEGVNTRYYEMGFNGFEDQAYDVSSDCSKPHFDFQVGAAGTSTVTTAYAHTGRYSLVVSATEQAYHTSEVENSMDHTTTDHGKPYTIQEQELIKPHTFLASTTEAQKYVLTLWVKELATGAQVTNYSNADIQVWYNGSQIMNAVEHRTNIIDGWQRVEVTFEIPAVTVTTQTCSVKLLNNSSQPMYFDDVRIQPYNSEMVSYVIDPVSLRLWATLDSRNFATFYQYDEEGSLVRIIQETERGRITVQENRAGIRIN
ncbi:MAG: hypothetical protein HYZ14_06325 [Bacteroidetes bacterium]|nr:hypothetical protein [Bacteroidota bacterium]